ncbi:transglycosylase domain-containing protein, partial [Arthrobacter sp. SDTb3-6]|uniref:transglycosylase domain-containing protein n=1 Tax=Arthrobacter sp. SDTb3-6 TaxID=2713571 RepID=UPI00159EB26B
MKATKNRLFDTTSTLGRLLLLGVVSIVCGTLVAGLLAPATALAATVADGSISMFNHLPGTLDVDQPAQTTKVLANDGSVIARFYAEDRHDVSLADMSPYIKTGIVAIEDARFYQHGGIDPTGILRAVVATVHGGREGASTITQQYVNNVIIQNLVSKGQTSQVVLGAQKTVGDKLKEMRLAIALEKKYSKDQILQGYLNLIYFGNGAYGIQAAAKLYFDTDAKNLSLPQAAALAGVVNSPTVYDPVAHPANVVTRRNQVLSKMLAQKKITQKQYAAAVKAPLVVHLHKTAQGCVAAKMAPYFCDYVQQLVLNNSAYGTTPEERSKFL